MIFSKVNNMHVCKRFCLHLSENTLTWRWNICDFDGSTDKRNNILGHLGEQDYFNRWNAKSTSGCVACTCTMNISGPPPSLRFSLHSWHWRRRQRAWTVSQDSKPGTKSELALLCSACSSTCYTPLRLKPESITDLTLLVVHCKRFQTQSAMISNGAWHSATKSNLLPWQLYDYKHSASMLTLHFALA